MVKLYRGGAFLVNGNKIIEDNADAENLIRKTAGKLPATGSSTKDEARKNTMAYSILKNHNTGKTMEKLLLKFDAMASHDITYVGIIQTAKASGLESFPLPYVMTNCHNSLCAVGGTINEDDHLFGLSAAKKYGGIFVPPHQAVIHQYMREQQAACGKMILGSDSHTRYGALGTLAIGEGGPELVKQLLGKTYDLDCPKVVGVLLTGKPAPGVGPQDVALALIGAVFGSGFVKNKVLEFVGDGIEGLDVEYRSGIDVMTTETTCLSSIWVTDEKVKNYYLAHGREEAYLPIAPGSLAYYDGMIEIDLSSIRPMIALPFHPSNVYTIEELLDSPYEILHKAELVCQKQLENPNFTLTDKIVNGKIYAEQGIIAGCAGGTYDNLCDVADILRGKSVGNGEFGLSLYPASQPILYSLTQNGAVGDFIEAGATVRTAFCGPCFGAGDVPANNGLSIRHSTRNFPNREGSKPGDGQVASVALMDARSIAATAINGGWLTPSTALSVDYTKPAYTYNPSIYEKRVYNGYTSPQGSLPLRFGPNIAQWPPMIGLADNLILQVASVINDPVTTTDELIPSGETSSYRSNPMRLAEFTLSRKDPLYVSRAKEIRQLETNRLVGESSSEASPQSGKLSAAFALLEENGFHLLPESVEIGSVICAKKPGDGSAREQAASCQRVLGGLANIAIEYATKRYRSNLINWGLLPLLQAGEELDYSVGDIIFFPNIRQAIELGKEELTAYRVGSKLVPLSFGLSSLTDNERQIILDGCLINFYRP